MYSLDEQQIPVDLFETSTLIPPYLIKNAKLIVSHVGEQSRVLNVINTQTGRITSADNVGV